jgi:tight adherence protein C
VDNVQIFLLSLFFAFSLGLAIWSMLSLNAEARSGSFEADELFTSSPLYKAFLPYIQTFGRKIDSIKAFDKMRKDMMKKLNAAGKADLITPGELIATQVYTGFGGLSAGLYFDYNLELGFEIVIGFYLLGFLMPALSLRDAIKKRQRSIKRVLPYTLDLLTLAVEAGLDFTTALMKIGRKIGENPLNLEITRLVRDLSMGKSRSQALKDMAERTGVEELGIIVSALVQADELGASLGPTLRIQSSEMRRKRFDAAEKAAMEAPVKMLFPLLAFIFPIIFLIIFGPIVIQFYYDSPL